MEIILSFNLWNFSSGMFRYDVKLLVSFLIIIFYELQSSLFGPVQL